HFVSHACGLRRPVAFRKLGRDPRLIQRVAEDVLLRDPDVLELFPNRMESGSGTNPSLLWRHSFHHARRLDESMSPLQQVDDVLPKCFVIHNSNSLPSNRKLIAQLFGWMKTRIDQRPFGVNIHSSFPSPSSTSPHDSIGIVMQAVAHVGMWSLPSV